MTTGDPYDVHALAETLALVENTLALLDEQIDRRTGDGSVVGPTPAATENRNVRLAAARIARANAAELRRRASSLAEATAVLRERNSSSRAVAARLIAASRGKTDGRAGGARPLDLDRLAGRLVGATDIAEVLEPTLRVLRSLVPDGGAAGALVRTGKLIDVGATLGPRAEASLRTEVDTGRGPGTEAMRSGTVVALPDLLDARAGVRWPYYRDQVVGAGVRAVLALPLRGNQQRPAGALVLVSGTPGAFGPDVVEAGRSCAALAALALLKVQGAASATRAIATRDRIGQAKGLLMQQHGIDADEASDQLIRTSQGPNIKLVAVADEVVRAHLAREFAHRTA